MTIYEVMFAFLEDLFPSTIVTAYNDILVLTAFIMTYILVFSIIILPLYRIATYLLKVGNRR